MRILLINTNQERWPIPAAPIGLSLVASSLRKAGHELRVIDRMFLFSKKQEESTFTEIIREFKPELIGISIRNVDNTCMSALRYYLPEIKEVVTFLKGLTEVPFVVGGPGYSLFPVEALKYLGLEFGIQGEGEVASVQLAQALTNGNPSFSQISGLVYRENGSFKTNQPTLIPDLEVMEPAAFDLLNYKKYIQKKSYIGLQTKRGCAFKCIYCEHPRIDGKKYRLKSPQKVVDEIIQAQKFWNLDYFFFVDSVFNFPTDHACTLCEEIIRRDVKIKWYANVNPVGISEDMAVLMARSGCIGADVGIDVASEEMLERMGKSFTQAEIAHATACYKKAGITTSFQLLLGGPGESRETITDGFKFLESITQPDNILTVLGIRIYPDTPLFSMAKPEDLVFMGEQGDFLSPTFHFPHTLTRSDFQMVEDWCKKYPHWSTPLDPWQYFNVMRVTRVPKFGKFKSDDFSL
jgi:radical SAM superfamily enzyme YgiQ (UPF0313 family)